MASKRTSPESTRRTFTSLDGLTWFLQLGHGTLRTVQQPELDQRRECPRSLDQPDLDFPHIRVYMMDNYDHSRIE